MAAQAQIKELSATGVQLRDDKAALTVSLQETQAALRKEQECVLEDRLI